MRRLILLPLLALALLSGCKGNCRKLAEQLCECSANTNERQACLQAVSNRASVITVTSENEQDCGLLIPQCDCHTVGTVEGKYRCGLARLPLP